MCAEDKTDCQQAGLETAQLAVLAGDTRGVSTRETAGEAWKCKVGAGSVLGERAHSLFGREDWAQIRIKGDLKMFPWVKSVLTAK